MSVCVSSAVRALHEKSGTPAIMAPGCPATPTKRTRRDVIRSGHVSSADCGAMDVFKSADTHHAAFSARKRGAQQILC